MRDGREDIVFQKGLRIAEEISRQSESQGRKRRPDDANGNGTQKTSTGTSASRTSSSSETSHVIGLCQFVDLSASHCVPSEEECLMLPPSRHASIGQSELPGRPELGRTCMFGCRCMVAASGCVQDPCVCVRTSPRPAALPIGNSLDNDTGSIPVTRHAGSTPDLRAGPSPIWSGAPPAQLSGIISFMHREALACGLESEPRQRDANSSQPLIRPQSFPAQARQLDRYLLAS